VEFLQLRPQCQVFSESKSWLCRGSKDSVVSLAIRQGDPAIVNLHPRATNTYEKENTCMCVHFDDPDLTEISPAFSSETRDITLALNAPWNLANLFSHIFMSLPYRYSTADAGVRSVVACRM